MRRRHPAQSLLPLAGADVHVRDVTPKVHSRRRNRTRRPGRAHSQYRSHRGLRKNAECFFQVGNVLRERDNVFLKSWNASVALTQVTAASQVTHTDLHVVQRNQHGLHDGGIARQVKPLFISSSNVQPEQRISIVARGESSHSAKNRLLSNLR